MTAETLFSHSCEIKPEGIEHGGQYREKAKQVIAELLTITRNKFFEYEWSEYEIESIGTAVAEALLNAVEHGNLEFKSTTREQGDDAVEKYFKSIIDPIILNRSVVFTLVFHKPTAENVEATIKITDEGTGFNPDDLFDPTTAEKLEGISGRGILLMRCFMDEVFFNIKGNQVTMVKRKTNGKAVTA